MRYSASIHYQKDHRRGRGKGQKERKRRDDDTHGLQRGSCNTRGRVLTRRTRRKQLEEKSKREMIERREESGQSEISRTHSYLFSTYVLIYRVCRIYLVISASVAQRNVASILNRILFSKNLQSFRYPVLKAFNILH